MGVSTMDDANEIVFTNRDELDVYNKKLLSEFVKYINKEHKTHHNLFNCCGSIKIVLPDDFVDDFVKKIKLS